MRSLFPIVVACLLVVGGPLAATAPFEVSSGRPMVELTVNGEGPYPFVLDTGAPGLIVRPELVEELELEVLGTTEVNSPLGGTPVEVQQVHVDSIDLGGASTSGLEAIVIEHLGKAGLGMGVVGPALFRAHGPLKLDFKDNTLTIGDDVKPEGVETWIPFGKSAPLLDIPVQIGELRIDGHIDTGSPGVLAVPSRYEEQLPLSGPVRTVGMARTVDDEFEIRAAPIETTVRVGDAQIPLREVHLAKLPVVNLGTGGLRGLTLYVDWKQERFALTGTADPVARMGRMAKSQAVPAGEGPRFGVRARPTGDGAIEVVGTDPGSPAEKIGLLAGDRIIAINGKPTAELEHAQVRAELVKPGLELTVERDGETIRLKQKD
jgi:predicted aspartyl protease